MFEKRLPFPTKPLILNSGTIVEEYIIPYKNKKEILKSMYPFGKVPGLTEYRIDLHCEKKFQICDFRVTREHELNYLVSPYYPESGGTVIDWMPIDYL
jgi:hypothetical protein